MSVLGCGHLRIGRCMLALEFVDCSAKGLIRVKKINTQSGIAVVTIPLAIPV